LNLVTKGHYGRLNRKWNQIPENGTLDLNGNIHFAGSEKPWSPNSRRNGSEVWLQSAADLLVTVLKSSRYKLNNALYHNSLNNTSSIFNHLIKVILSKPQLKMKYLDITFVESIKVLEKIIEDQRNKS
jgi:lipopolysaccharide biosynthesis glycosyltransferase